MWKKAIIISLCISVLFVLSAPITPANAGSKNVNWNVAGPVANNLEVSVNISPPGQPPLFVDIPHYLINISAKGPPGPAEITLMGYGLPEPNYENNDPCDKEEYILQINIKVNDMVARFPDLSLLFATNIPNSSYLCVNTSTGISTWHAEMLFVGGTGIYNGVSGGQITGNGEGYSISGNALGGEVGTIKGNIIY